ncbi:hypothetical protein Hypma_011941 [Hypsizygus marmoreus]|uniref:Uncharacterized protein n=1 Tax=Hypsizygus marmoreus TaxID=39966 RepID=A0A369JL79_HYPMA|nr:hypothetical protein Hypma_011941 [Hypsizygus marmoreus]
MCSGRIAASPAGDWAQASATGQRARRRHHRLYVLGLLEARQDLSINKRSWDNISSRVLIDMEQMNRPLPPLFHLPSSPLPARLPFPPPLLLSSLLLFLFFFLFSFLFSTPSSLRASKSARHSVMHLTADHLVTGPSFTSPAKPSPAKPSACEVLGEGSMYPRPAASAQISGFSGARFKGYYVLEDAVKRRHHACANNLIGPPASAPLTPLLRLRLRALSTAALP